MKLFSNTLPADTAEELERHYADTYFALRSGLAALAFAMPLVLFLWGKFSHGLDLQASMSAYFWAASKDQCASFPMRTVFVGFLFAISVALYAYKGLTKFENTLLNAAAVCGMVVALFPERLDDPDQKISTELAQLYADCPAIEQWARVDALPIHYIAAGLLFILLAIVAWLCAQKSLEFLPANHDAEKFRRLYKGIAIAMIVFPLLGLILAFVLGSLGSKVFYIEAAGIVTFGGYWAVKSFELSLSKLESDPTQAMRSAPKRQMKEGP